TLVIAWLVRQMLTVSWCGDSRAYILHGGQLEMLTHDHSYVQELVDKGELDYEASFSHPDNNIVTHCLGANDESSVKADSRTTDVENGDIILLCSDGISGVLFDDARFYKGKPLSAENLQDTLVRNCADAKDAAAELIAAAERCGWHDNATAIVCRIADGSHPPRTAFRWLRRHWWVLIVAIALGIVVKHLPPATQTEQPEGTDTIENAPAETTAETSEPVVKTDTVYEPAKKPAKKSNTAADTCPVATGKGFKGNVNIGLLAAGGCMPLTNGKDTSANETESTDNNEVPGESAEKTDSN
ncbi:MAG: SpoIIE family protein phosphatase, partial [Bacteroidales bacterium]|nr:SpoIIE family protein phosphatase [Bacteroidales bacterium]